MTTALPPRFGIWAVVHGSRGAYQMKAIQRQNTDPKVVMMQTMQKTPRVGTNGGTAAGLVGSYDEVAACVRAFHAARIELFMLQFQPFEAEMRRFALEVIPRVRQLGPATAVRTPEPAALS